MSKMFIVVGLIFTLVATIFLFLGSRHLPWNIQTIGGKSNSESKFFKSRRRESVLGFILLFVGFLLQLIGAILQ